jgi:hypothetical protein
MRRIHSQQLVLIVVFSLLGCFFLPACTGTRTGTPLLDPPVQVILVTPTMTVSGGTVEETPPPTSAGDIPAYPPINAKYEVKGHECKGGKATSVTIDLIISGGLPPYTTSPKLPLLTEPGKLLSIMIYSNTDSQEPSREIKIDVPTKFDCPKEDTPTQRATSPDPDPTQPTQPPPTEPPPTEPPPTEEPVCRNPQGHIIPCH